MTNGIKPFVHAFRLVRGAFWFPLIIGVGLLLMAVGRGLVFSWELDSLTMRQKLFSSHPEDRRASTPITLVAVDLRTLHSPVYNRLFDAAFSREGAAYAVRFMKRVHPRMVVFDVSFNGGVHYADPGGDRALVDSLKGSRRFASLLSLDPGRQPELTFPVQPLAAQAALRRNVVTVRGLDRFPIFEKNYHFTNAVLPYPDLLNTSMSFYAANSFAYRTILNAEPTDDLRNQSRRWTPFALYGGHVFPTLPLGILLNGEKNLSISPDGRLRWNHHTIDLGKDGVPLIKWRGHGVYASRPVYAQVSFADIALSEWLLECRENPRLAQCRKLDFAKVRAEIRPLNPAWFRDRYVIIGLALPSHVDNHPTIYGPKYSGLYIVANILDNAIHNDFIQAAPTWLNFLCCLFWPALLGLVCWRFRSVKICLLVALTLAMAHILLCIYTYNHWNCWIDVVYPVLLTLLFFCAAYVSRYHREYQKRRQLRSAFGKYVSPAILQRIEKNPEKVTLGGERRVMSFLFSDIRDFTTFSDQHNPEEVQAFLTQYFSTMNRIILHVFHGSINKLIGDAIMAYWGFPLDDEDHAFLAVSAALAMRDAMHAWEQEEGRQPIRIGIGVNTGEAVIGNIGSEDFMDFTVIGDAVNVASRLESANKTYGTTIIISRATYDRVRDRIEARSLGWAELKGKDGKVEIFEPLGFLPSPATVRLNRLKHL